MTRRVLSGIACAVTAMVTAQAQTVALTGGTVYPVSSPRIEHGAVLIHDGKIAAVGVGIEIPSGAQRIDVTGKVVTPGFINAATYLGAMEIWFVPSTIDNDAHDSSGVAATFRVWDGINPASETFPVVRRGGVTSAVVLPTGGLISGQGALITLAPEASVHDLVIHAPTVMVAQVDDPASAQVGARGALVAKLRALLDDARAFARMHAAANTSRHWSVPEKTPVALEPVMDGRMPLLVHADRASDIDVALDLAQEYGLKLVLIGGAEAWMRADRLAALHVPVLTGPYNLPETFNSLGARQDGPALLRRAGVDVVLVADGEGVLARSTRTWNAADIRFAAGRAVAHGMTWDDALRSLTLIPAEVFGVAGRIGALRPGMDANIVVWSGDPFEPMSRVERVLINGRQVSDTTRADMLLHKYLHHQRVAR